MDRELLRAFLWASVSVEVVGCGLFIVDLALRDCLRLQKRIVLYVGVLVSIIGLTPVGMQLRETEEWRVIKLSADYYDTIKYHRERRIKFQQMKEFSQGTDVRCSSDVKGQN